MFLISLFSFFPFLFFFLEKSLLFFLFLVLLSDMFRCKKKNCFLYLFFSFLAFVLGFKNVSLRSRCSMEMWCPDDIGRDSWDWVGPPPWERARFNSPEWGGSSSPVKTEPLWIVLLLLLLFVRFVRARRRYLVKRRDPWRSHDALMCTVYGHKVQQRCKSHWDQFTFA